MRHSTREELQANEQTFRAIFENTPAGLIVTDDRGVVLDCNRRFTEIFGAKRQDYLGMNLLERIPDGPVRQNFVGAVTDGQLHRYEGPYRSIVTGRESYLLITSQMAVSGRVFTVIEDIGERMRVENDLRASEEKYRRVFDNELYPMALFDLDTLRIIDANEALCRLYGYTRDELLGGMIARDLTAEPEASRHLFEDLQRTESVIVLERYHRKKDGTVFPVEFFIGRQSVGGRPAALAMVRDITERKRADEAIRLQTSRLSSAMEASNQGWFDLDVQAGTAKVSPEWGRLLGYEPKFSTSFQNWLDQIHPEDRDEVLAAFSEGVAKGSSATVEYRRRTKAGEWKWIRSIGKVVGWDAQGKPARMTGVHADISDLREKEHEVREANKLLRTIFEVSPVYMSITDLATGKVTDANDACVRFLGIRREEILGKTSLELNVWVSDADRDKVFDEIRAGNDVTHMETSLRTNTGQSRDVLLSSRRIEVNGQPSILTSVHDITERKQAEEALQRAKNELEETVRQRTIQLENAKRLLELDIERRERADLEKERMEGQLRQSQVLEAVGRLAGGVAHDFNNLLASVLGCAWVAGTPNAEPKDIRRELDRIQELCRQGGEVTRQLLAVARQTKGVLTSLDLGVTLRQVRVLLERACPKTVSVVFQESMNLPPVFGDRGLLATALLNVCLNARDAMPDGGTLTVRAWKDGVEGQDWGVVEVSDTGEGISEELRDQIFQPFFSTKSWGRGAGLGLPMAFATAESMGGSLELAPDQGRGATFIFRLPASPHPTDSLITPYEETQNSRNLGLTDKTVLVVEDEEDIARFVERILAGCGARVARARTGLEALEAVRAREDTLTLILLDLILPEISGTTVYRALAAGAPHIPVVFMTGRDDVATDAASGVPVLKKPFSEHELMESLRRAILGNG